MKTSKFSEAQCLAIIGKQGPGMTIEEICREHQISPATFHKWKKGLADDQNVDKLRLKKLEQGNARLKKMYTELKMDHDILQTYYHRKSGHRPEVGDLEIAVMLRQTVSVFIAWGFWLVYHYLRGQGHDWNHKRVYRVWKEEGLHLRKAPQRPKIKRKHLNLLPPAQINEGWSVDFPSDWVVGPGKHKVRIVNVMDECSRKALWTEAHGSVTAQKLTGILDEITAWRGAPAYIRCDNGPEFISRQLKEWSSRHRVDIKFIQLGKPSQNGLIERLNGTLRTECLNLEWFTGIGELNERIQEWWHIYNSVRPHSSIGYRPPDQFERKNSNLYFKVVEA